MMRPERRVSRRVRSGADRACDLPVVVVELENSLTASGGVRRRVDQSGLRARHVDRVHAVVAVAAGRELMEIGVHAVRAIGPAQGAGYWGSSIGAIARTRGRSAVRVPIDGLVVLWIGHPSGLPRWGALSRGGCRCHGLGQEGGVAVARGPGSFPVRLLSYLGRRRGLGGQGSVQRRRAGGDGSKIKRRPTA